MGTFASADTYVLNQSHRPSIMLADFENTPSIFHRFYAMGVATSASISQALSLAPYTAMLRQLHTSMREVTSQVLDPKVSVRSFCQKRWVAFSSTDTGKSEQSPDLELVTKVLYQGLLSIWHLGATG